MPPGKIKVKTSWPCVFHQLLTILLCPLTTKLLWRIASTHFLNPLSLLSYTIYTALWPHYTKESPIGKITSSWLNPMINDQFCFIWPDWSVTDNGHDYFIFLEICVLYFTYHTLFMLAGMQCFLNLLSCFLLTS